MVFKPRRCGEAGLERLHEQQACAAEEERAERAEAARKEARRAEAELRSALERQLERQL